MNIEWKVNALLVESINMNAIGLSYSCEERHSLGGATQSQL